MSRQVTTAACLMLVALSVIGCGSEPRQAVPDATGPEVALRVAVEQMLRGQTEPASESSWFSSTTAGALRSVSVDSAGHAIVDFEDLRALIPNASSSAGSEMLLNELNATVFRVDAVRSVDYLIDGQCERFWEWLQYDCRTVMRSEAKAATPRP